MTRAYKDWEKCSLNMSGIHTWHLVAEKKGGKRVECHRCGSLPPTIHRGRIYDEISKALAVEKENRRKASLLRRATRGR